jgi:hypothetical protein
MTKSLGNATLSSEHVLRVRDYTTTPGGRYAGDGPFPGQEFLALHLRPAFEKAQNAGATLLVDLDGTAGYASSFLDEAFAGLVGVFGRTAVERIIRIKSTAEPYLEEDIRQYIAEA